MFSYKQINLKAFLNIKELFNKSNLSTAFIITRLKS